MKSGTYCVNHSCNCYFYWESSRYMSLGMEDWKMSETWTISSRGLQPSNTAEDVPISPDSREQM